MKKHSLIILTVLLMLLNACVKNKSVPETKPDLVTEKQIREKIDDILDIDGVNVIQTNFVIESNIADEQHQTVIVTVSTVKGLSTTVSKVTLHYLAMVNHYVYTNYELEKSSSTMAQGPTMAQAMAAAKIAMTDQTSFYNLSLSVMSFPNTDLKCLKSEPLLDDGSFFMTCTESYRMLNTSATGTAIIKATYAYNRGWSYKIDSWSLVAQTKFNDTFDLTFASTFANPDRWFTPGQTGKLSLNGSLTMIFRSDESITIDNQLTGSFMTKDVMMPLIVEAAKETDYLARVSPDALKLIFGSEEDAYLLIEAVDGMGHCGAASPPYWSGIDAYKNYFDLMSDAKRISPMMC